MLLRRRPQSVLASRARGTPKLLRLRRAGEKPFPAPLLVLLKDQSRDTKKGVRADLRFERLSEVKSPWLPARKLKSI
jgi:hypothetical protein